MAFVPRTSQCPPYTITTIFRPWSRIDSNTPDSIQGFTRDQLQMRLKYEVLQHKPKHPQLSNAQNYSLASRGNNYNRASRPKAFINENGEVVAGPGQVIVTDAAGNNIGLVTDNTQCPNNNVISYSNQSDVPGPITAFTLDPTVPLINYGPPRRTYPTTGTISDENLNSAGNYTSNI